MISPYMDSRKFANFINFLKEQPTDLPTNRQTKRDVGDRLTDHKKYTLSRPNGFAGHEPALVLTQRGERFQRTTTKG